MSNVFRRPQVDLLKVVLLGFTYSYGGIFPSCELFFIYCVTNSSFFSFLLEVLLFTNQTKFALFFYFIALEYSSTWT